MKKSKLVVINRRKLVTGLASTCGLLLAGCSSKELPPTYGNVLRMGDLLTYRAFRTLLPAQSLVREYGRSDITSSPAVGTSNPADPHEELYNAERGPLFDRIRAERLRTGASGSRAGSRGRRAFRSRSCRPFRPELRLPSTPARKAGRRLPSGPACPFERCSKRRGSNLRHAS